MNLSDLSSDDPIAEEILRYLLEHPDAKDTAEGVADWWLLNRKVSPGVAEVEASLRRLVELGAVGVDTREDGKRHYYLKLSKKS